MSHPGPAPVLGSSALILRRQPRRVKAPIPLAAREGIGVAIPPGSAAPKKATVEGASAGYQSNSWRQAPRETARALSFSSRVLAPSTGLDPSLLDSYFLLACADDLARTSESDEGNNCVATPTAAVTVTRPDLLAATVSAPPTTRARGTTFAMTDTVRNAGAVASGPSATRYYLSLDAVKSAADILLTAGRAVPGLAAGGRHSGAVTLTVTTATPLNTYFVLACADGASAVPETDETNNCTATSTTVTITP